MPQERDGLIPVVEIPDTGYTWFKFNEDQTGLQFVGLEDHLTGAVVSTQIRNPGVRVAAFIAWAGSRHSRAPGPSWKIASEMGRAKALDPDAKLEELFHGYKHKSPGDMARLMVGLDNIPLHFALTMFYLGYINSGQEKSTRFQSRFSRSVLHPLSNYLSFGFGISQPESLKADYQSLGEQSLSLFNKYRNMLTPEFTDYFQIDPNNSEHKKALTARVLDSARYFLLSGQNTGIAFETSARDWARIIAQLKGSNLAFHQEMGNQLHRLLVPNDQIERDLGYLAEAPGLVRHTAPDYTTNTNLRELHAFIDGQTDFDKQVLVNTNYFLGEQPLGAEVIAGQYSVSEKVVAQYLLTIFPGADVTQLLDWVKTQQDGVKEQISQIIFQGHDHRYEMQELAKSNETTVVVKGSIGDIRDWNRHRAFTRFIPLPLAHSERWDSSMAKQVLARGFQLPAYLTDVAAFSDLRQAFSEDLTKYYDNVYQFLDKVQEQFGEKVNYAFLLNVLPLAHQMDIWLSGDPGQFNYALIQRYQPGGHINYRIQAYQANQLVADDAYLSAMRIQQSPNPANRDEFLDRS